MLKVRLCCISRLQLRILGWVFEELEDYTGVQILVGI